MVCAFSKSKGTRTIIEVALRAIPDADRYRDLMLCCAYAINVDDSARWIQYVTAEILRDSFVHIVPEESKRVDTNGPTPCQYLPYIRGGRVVVYWW